MDAASLFGAIGGAGGFGALAYVIKVMIDARRESSRSVNEDRRAPLLDTAAANLVLRESLSAMTLRAAAQDERIASLEARLESRDKQLDQRDAEIDRLTERVRQAESKMRTIADEHRAIAEELAKIKGDARA